jgi:hypothetical protein
MTTNTLIKSPTLKELYQSIYNLSIALLNNFTDDAMIATAQKRSDLLQEIKTVEKELKKKFPAPKVFDEETKLIMAKVIKLDALITKKSQDRLDQIRTEMKGLYSKSRATKAYAVCKKR